MTDTLKVFRGLVRDLELLEHIRNTLTGVRLTCS